MSIGYTNPAYAGWRADTVRALLALADQDGARELADENLALARTFEEPRTISIALRTVGRVRGHRDGLPLLREAVAVTEESPGRLERARTPIDYGEALRRTGQRTEAREPLRRRLDVAHCCGARVVADSPKRNSSRRAAVRAEPPSSARTH